MSRVNIYLPDELADRARRAELNVSALARAAIEAELSSRAGETWLGRYGSPPDGPDHATVLRALDEARDEFGADARPPTEESRRAG